MRKEETDVNVSLHWQNVTANHRVNDVIATEDGQQTLVGRFMYGPLDMVTLTGEKVCVYVPMQIDTVWAPDHREVYLLQSVPSLFSMHPCALICSFSNIPSPPSIP